MFLGNLWGIDRRVHARVASDEKLHSFAEVPSLTGQFAQARRPDCRHAGGDPSRGAHLWMLNPKP